jgi:hypothetical protein
MQYTNAVAYVYINYCQAKTEPRIAIKRRLSPLHPAFHFWPLLSTFRSANGIPENLSRVVAQFTKSLVRWTLCFDAGTREHGNIPFARFTSTYLTGGVSRVLFFYTDLHLNRKRPADRLTLFADESTVESVVDRLAAFQTAFVFDCPESGLIRRAFAPRGDSVAFFSRSDESAAVEPTLLFPLDVFTMSMIDPATVVRQWHFRRRGIAGAPPDTSDAFTTDLVNSTVRAIAADSMPPDAYKRFFVEDARLAQLFVGFVVAARVCADGGIVPASEPQIPSMVHHRFWSLLDLVLDSPDLFAAYHSLRFAERVRRRLPDWGFDIAFIAGGKLAAIDSLAVLLDGSLAAIDLALDPGLAPLLLANLQQAADDATMFCLTKLLARAPSLVSSGSRNVVCSVCRCRTRIAVTFLAVYGQRLGRNVDGGEGIRDALVWDDAAARVWSIHCLGVWSRGSGNAHIDALLDRECIGEVEVAATVWAFARMAANGQLYLSERAGEVIEWVLAAQGGANTRMMALQFLRAFRELTKDGDEAVPKLAGPFIEECTGSEEPIVAKLAGFCLRGDWNWKEGQEMQAGWRYDLVEYHVQGLLPPGL